MKTWQGLIYGLMIICCLLFAGCAGREDARSFIPLKPGVIWYYDVNIQGETVQMQAQVGEPQKIEGNNAYPVTYSSNEKALPTLIEYYVIEDQKILFPRLDNVQGQFVKTPIQTYLKFPLKKGANWKWSGKLLPVGEKEAVARETVETVVVDHETVTTPLRKFKNAVRISFLLNFHTEDKELKIKGDRWYVKKFGMVKEVLYDEKGNQVLVAVLKKLDK